MDLKANHHPCKYNAEHFCTPNCNSDICFFRFSEDMFYDRDERPSMKKSKPKKKFRIQ